MPNYILSIDTSAGTSVAVLQDGAVCAELNNAENMKHAEQIGEAIAQVIAACEINSSQISSVVVGRGPAPFTGLRIGIAAGVMFAEAVGAELFGVVSLDAIARTALVASPSESTELLVTADARRSEVYWAIYSGLSKHGAPVMVAGPGVAKPQALEEQLVGRNLARTDIKVTAGELGKVFESQVLAGTASRDVSALYLREADAVVPKDLREAGKRVSG